MDTKRPDSPFFAGKTAKDPGEKMLEKGPFLEKGPKGENDCTDHDRELYGSYFNIKLSCFQMFSTMKNQEISAFCRVGGKHRTYSGKPVWRKQ